MLKILIISRAILVIYFVAWLFGPIIDISVPPSNFGLNILAPIVLILLNLIVFLALTTWIDSIDAHLNPKPPIPAEIKNKKAIVTLLFFIVAAAIMYWFPK